MAKITLNESELTQMIEEAAKRTISKILKEGAGLDSFIRGVKGGYRGDYEHHGENFKQRAMDYIKNGQGAANYDDFVADSDEYDRAVKAHDRALSNLKNKKKDADSYSTDDLSKAYDNERTAKQNRVDAAGQMISSRPGIIGKGQRAAAVGGVNIGRFGKKIKDKVTDFAHNTIGLKEEE